VANRTQSSGAQHQAFKEPNQQSLRGRSISLLVVRARTTNLDDLLILMPDVLGALETLKPGEVVRIGIR
jgi:hypothetical protein